MLRRGIPYGPAVRAGWHPLAAVYHYGTKDVQTIRKGVEAEAAEAYLENVVHVNYPPANPFKKTVGRGIRHLDACVFW